MKQNIPRERYQNLSKEEKLKIRNLSEDKKQKLVGYRKK